MALVPAAGQIVVDGLGNQAAVQLWTTFCVGFENAFSFTPRGALKVDNATCAGVEQWFNDSRLLIVLITGIDVQPVHFPVQGQRDIGIANQIRNDMLHYYAISFGAYIKYAQTLRRNIPVRYRPAADLVVDEDDD